MFFIKWEQNHRAWHLHKQRLRKCYKVYENEAERQSRQKTENAERRKADFPQEKEENADFSKLVLNKIMTSDEKCVKCNFIAPIKFEFGLFI